MRALDKLHTGANVTNSKQSHWWDYVRSSLWFVPAAMAVAAAALAFASSAIDQVLPEQVTGKLPLVFSGRPDGARTVLSTIATAMIGVAGVVFSMTIVSLQLASSQFGPRLLRTFLRDRGNQVVLGTFLSTFLYCIIILPAVDATPGHIFVPRVSVTLGVLLATLSLGMLVYFIDHVAQSIHADAVLWAVSLELNESIDQLFPAEVGDDDASHGGDQPPAHEGKCESAVPATASGYVRFIDAEALVRIAAANELMVSVEARPGHFVVPEQRLATVWSNDTQRATQLLPQLGSAFSLGVHQTALQDVGFGFEQLSEMALRALSPGINDPTTAIHCIDRIAEAAARLVARPWPDPWRTDSHRRGWVAIPPIGLAEILDHMVVPIARVAGVHFPVWQRLLQTLETCHHRARRELDRIVLASCASATLARAKEAPLTNEERTALEESAAWAVVAGIAAQSP